MWEKQTGGRVTDSPHQDPLPCHLCSVKKGAGEINRGRRVGSSRWASSLLARGRTEQRQAGVMYYSIDYYRKIYMTTCATHYSTARPFIFLRERCLSEGAVRESCPSSLAVAEVRGRWTVRGNDADVGGELLAQVVD
jgi:hypothetical protein